MNIEYWLGFKLVYTRYCAIYVSIGTKRFGDICPKTPTVKMQERRKDCEESLAADRFAFFS